jgi:hypothetical protein
MRLPAASVKVTANGCMSSLAMALPVLTRHEKVLLMGTSGCSSWVRG